MVFRRSRAQPSDAKPLSPTTTGTVALGRRRVTIAARPARMPPLRPNCRARVPAEGHLVTCHCALVTGRWSGLSGPDGCSSRLSELRVASVRPLCYSCAVAVSEHARAVFRRIGEVEAEVRPAPPTFDDALTVLNRLLERDRAMFPDRVVAPDDDELHAHEALYARARALGMDRD